MCCSSAFPDVLDLHLPAALKADGRQSAGGTRRTRWAVHGFEEVRDKDGSINAPAMAYTHGRKLSSTNTLRHMSAGL